MDGPAHKLLEAETMTTTTDDAPELAESAEAPTEDRPCDVCDEPGTTAEYPQHGECLLRGLFGGVAQILTPEDVGVETNIDGGLTVRQSAWAVETIIDKSTADAILRGKVLDDASLDERREMLAYVVAIVSGDFEPLERLSPQLARALRVKIATRDLIDMVTRAKDDEGEDEAEAEKPADE